MVPRWRTARRSLLIALCLLVLLSACARQPAGLHECALLFQEEVDEYLGAEVGPGSFNAPLITVSVCAWGTEQDRLVLTLFQTPPDGIADIVGAANPIPSDVGDAFETRSVGSTQVWLIANDLVIDMARIAESPGSSDDLLRLAELISRRLS